MHLFKWILASTSIAFLLAGCTQPQKDDAINGPGRSATGSFRAVKCDGKAQDFSKVHPKASWPIPMVANLRLSACLEDYATHKRAEGHTFEIVDPDSGKHYLPDNQNGTSDGGGCISWTDELPFNVFAKRSAPVEIVRRIVGTGVHSGYHELRFAVNPWSIKGDLRRDDTEAVTCLLGDNASAPAGTIKNKIAAAQALSGEPEKNAEIWIKDVSIDGVSRRVFAGGETMDLAFEIRPHVILKDQYDGPHTIDLEYGEFEVLAHLIVEDFGPNQNTKTILTENAMSTNVKVKGRTLQFNLKTDFRRYVPGGTVYLALRLIPVNMPHSAHLNVYDGIFRVGSLRNLDHITAKPAERCLTDESRARGECNVGIYLKQSRGWEKLTADEIALKEKVDTEEYQKQLEAAGITPWEKLGSKDADVTDPSLRIGPYKQNYDALSFGQLSLRFINVRAQPAETATERTIQYSGKTCVHWRRSGEKVVDTPFKVAILDDSGKETRITVPELDEKGKIKPDSKPMDPRTDADGCLHFSANVEHQYYMPEQFIHKRLRITYANTTAGTTIDYVLNPWDFGFTFGFDVSEIGSEYLAEIQQRKKIHSRFFTHGFGYHTVRFLYSFDKYLMLQAKKTVLLEIEPRVLRYSGIMNARRTTEQIRDGVYLLKVAFEKHFLDPATNRVKIGRTEDPNLSKRGASIVYDKNKPIPEVMKNQYISTFTSLVRIVDGRLIKPVTLTMRDLRLMRMRANFLIQLEPVDEKEVNRDSLMQRYFNNSLVQELMQVRDEWKDKVPMDDYIAKLKAAVATTRESYRRYDGILRMDLEKRKNVMAEYDLPEGLQENLRKLLAKTGDFTEFDLNPCDMDETKCNRFRVNYPPGVKPEDAPVYTPEMIDKGWGSGLAARTFVGPVIFLSNGYSDAVRATDNLDEAKCGPDNPWLSPTQRETALNRLRRREAEENQDQTNQEAAKDPRLSDAVREALEKDKAMHDVLLGASEMDWYAKAETAMANDRQNISYEASPYYGSLTHLCYISVDELIARERSNLERYEKLMPQLSSPENFAATNYLDYYILNPQNETELSGESKVVKSKEETLRLLNQNFESRNSSGLWGAYKSFGKTDGWDESELKAAFFGEEKPKDEASSQAVPQTKKNAIPDYVDDFNLEKYQAFAVCNIIANRISGSEAFGHLAVHERRLKHFSDLVFNYCMNNINSSTSSLIHLDEKLWVRKPGQYTFTGGLQMNFNVGESYGISRTNRSLGSGFEYADLVPGALSIGGGIIGFFAGGGPWGAVAGAIAGWELGKPSKDLALGILKPLSLKDGKSFSDSDGTSVSAQTYLVTQIAKFNVELETYERCRAFRPVPEFAEYVMNQAVAMLPRPRDGYDREKIERFIEESTALKENVRQAALRGIFVCDGVEHKNRRVDEDYFYFTQHFTEGDMLDQADILNNPWLLQLRGDRDFGIFLRTMKAQEVVNLSNFGWGMPGFKPEPREIDWPLEKLASTYGKTTPTFPGIYTVLRPSERITSYPLGKRIINIDEDLNKEICNRPGGGCQVPWTPPGTQFPSESGQGYKTPYPVERRN